MANSADGQCGIPARAPQGLAEVGMARYPSRHSDTNGAVDPWLFEPFGMALLNLCDLSPISFPISPVTWSV